MIKVDNLTVNFGGVRALHNISLEISRGEFVLISGPSGCGKSTLALAMSGLIPQSIPADIDGRVRVVDLDTQEHDVSILSQLVGSVFQNPATQLFHLRVDEELSFGPRNLGLPEEEVKERVDWCLGATGIEALRHRPPAELSHGQMQRVAISSVLAMKPEILILDEPTASLDILGTHKLMQTLENLNREHKMTIVLIEHRLADAVRLASRVILMDVGEVIADGKPSRVLADQPRRDQLGLRRPTRKSMSRWSNLISINRSSWEKPNPLISMKAVSAGYGKRMVINNLDLSLNAGEFTALVGENGAGKSTLGLLAAGMIKPTSGRIHFNSSTRMRQGQDVAMLFQVPSEQLFADSVDEEVGFAAHNFAIFDPARHRQILSQADLLEFIDRRPLALSVGQQQRTALAACLSSQPKLLILDEPTLGQDWGHLQQLMNYLTGLNRQGVAILLITHDFKLIHRYAQRILLMKAGRIVSDGIVRTTLKPDSTMEGVYP